MRKLFKSFLALSVGFSFLVVPIQKVHPQTNVSSGRLTVMGVSSPFSQVHLTPYNGNAILIGGIARVIPPGIPVVSGGLIGTVTNACIDKVCGQTLSPNTTYYIYAYMNGASVMTMDFSTNGRGAGTDAFGVWVHSQDPTRSLIGLCRTDETGKFAGTQNQQNVVSWFNRVRINLTIDLAGSTSSTTYVELDSTRRLTWVQWNDDVPSLNATVNVNIQLAGGSAQVGIGFDSSTIIGGPPAEFQSSADNHFANLAPFAITASSLEGYHFATFLMKGTAGSGLISVLGGQMFTSPLPS